MRKIDVVSLAKEVDQEMIEIIQRELAHLQASLNDTDRLENFLPDLMVKLITINKIFTVKLLEKALNNICNSDS
ncbi:hypothetical protein H1215_18640 [Anoxybacillus sp. LAT_38]|nr:hypothetical protein [Anoxybacillus sp. LAT_38]MCG6183291.1 hypothetical protein [Anoxybacillus sp. LAT_26]MCG6199184.1 hypothetical protein [Anoxybacillus sp. LAT_38]